MTAPTSKAQERVTAFLDRRATLRIVSQEEIAGVGDAEGDVLPLLASDLRALIQRAAVTDALTEAVMKCAGVLGGHELSKSALVDALEAARSALALAKGEQSHG